MHFVLSESKKSVVENWRTREAAKADVWSAAENNQECSQNSEFNGQISWWPPSSTCNELDVEVLIAKGSENSQCPSKID